MGRPSRKCKSTTPFPYTPSRTLLDLAALALVGEGVFKSISADGWTTIENSISTSNLHPEQQLKAVSGQGREVTIKYYGDAANGRGKFGVAGARGQELTTHLLARVDRFASLASSSA
jgi:hypothetical protein